jgi:hypothetical protein
MSTPGMDLIQDLRGEIAAVIRADPWFAPVSVLDNVEDDIVQKVQATVGKLGLVVVVELFPRGKIEYGVGAHTLELVPYITLTEQPLINRSASGTRKQIGEALIRLLALFNPNAAPAKPCVLEEVTIATQSQNGLYVIYQLRGRAQLGFSVT